RRRHPDQKAIRTANGGREKTSSGGRAGVAGRPEHRIRSPSTLCLRARSVMATLGELARQHTDLDLPSLGHLQRLMGSWGMLSDLCFADLLLFVPVIGGEGSRFIVLGQMRPTTNQTLHREDLVGRIIDEVERPL